MTNRVTLEGYENYSKFMESFDKKNKDIYIMFSGSKNPTGESWCSDCREAMSVIYEALTKYADPEAHFIYVEVGDRPTWKDMNCPFRLDNKLKLMVIPTLIKWDTPKRLEGEHCSKIELLELLFTDD